MPADWKTPLRVMLIAAVAAGPVFLAGCERTKRGRVPITEQTRGEERSDRILPIGLIEFSDQASELLKSELYGLPEVRDTAGPITVILGDINNQTAGVVPTSDFELVTSRIRSKLLNSNVGQNKVMFVERRARMQGLAAREDIRGANDPDAPANPPAYDAATTYTMNLDVYRVNRNNTNLYGMDMTLVSFSNNRIVFSDTYEIKQVN